MPLAARIVAVAIVPIASTVFGQTIGEPPPRRASPIVVTSGLAPAGAVAVAVDEAALALSANESGAFIIEAIPVGAGETRSLLVRRMSTDPALAIDVVTSSDEVVHLDGDAIAAAAGVIFAGEVIGAANSRAVLSFGPSGVFGLIDDGSTRFLISSGPFGMNRTLLAYNASAIAPELLPMAEWTCSAEELDKSFGFAGGGGVAEAAGPCRQFRIAADTDFEYFQLLGGSVQAAANYAILQVTAASEILASGPNARIGLTYLRLWATPEDPWLATSASGQLQQFRTHWIANMSDIKREVAHFLSGRVLGGGVAWTGSLCTDFAYSLSGNLTGYFPYPLINNNLQNWDVIVVTHEIAHNLGAIHTHQHGVDSPDFCGWGECQVASQGTLMSYCYICPGGMANIKLEFAPISVTKMLEYLNAIPCDFTPPAASLVAVDDFASALAGATIEIDLLKNDQTANCQAVAIETFEATSLGGGVIAPSSVPGRVLYKAPLGFTGIDSFAYSIKGSGVPAVGQAFIAVAGSIADLNGDGLVNGTDLGAVLGLWNTNVAAGDLNTDGTVDGNDMAIVLGSWTG